MVSLLLASANAWILDVVFLLVIIGGTLLGVHVGFIRGICKLAGTVFALIFSLIFCVMFANFLESAFGMTSAITNGIASGFASKDWGAITIPTDISGAELSSTLGELGITGFKHFAINISFKGMELIPAGTTIAVLFASVIAKWLSVVISYLILFVIIKLGVFLLGLLAGVIREKITFFRILDQALGGLLGLIVGVFLVFILLSICYWIPSDSLHEFISSGALVGSIFQSDWFVEAINYAVSGSWFTEYITPMLQ